MKPYTHIVRYYECDGMGITHHSNYVRFMEEARIDWMDQLGYGFERMEAEGVVSPVMAISCLYKRTTTFKDEIQIEVKVKEMSALKISFAYTMKVGDTVVCTASSTHCFLENNRPVALETRFPELYQAILNQSTSK
ncbi:MAG: acyl-CoA thioesterase [Paludibacteraceae bacterium]|nr:acyl-CoA thioesterase [Paludibacteraceae bacterium]